VSDYRVTVRAQFDDGSTTEISRKLHYTSAGLHGRARLGEGDRDSAATAPDQRHPFVAFAIARPKRARKQKQSCRAQAAHAWIWPIANAAPDAWPA